MDAPTLHSIWTVLLLVVFIGIVVWIFVLRKSSDFDEAARIPLDPDDHGNLESSNGDRQDG